MVSIIPKHYINDSVGLLATKSEYRAHLTIASASPLQRVRLIIADLGIPVEYIDVHLKDKPVWYIPKINPLGQVPVLEHEGRLVRESLIAFGEFNLGMHKLNTASEIRRLMPFGSYAVDLIDDALVY